MAVKPVTAQTVRGKEVPKKARNNLLRCYSTSAELEKINVLEKRRNKGCNVKGD